MLPLLAACGFEPVYGDRAASGDGDLLQQVVVGPMPGRVGQLFRASLEDQLNPDAETTTERFDLQPVLQVNLVPLSIEADGTISRYRVLYSSNFTLYDREAGKQIYADRIKRTGSFDVSDQADYSTYVAEQDAIARGLDELSHDYLLRIAAFLKRYEASLGQGA